MKKTLLFLFLFVCSSITAQINQNVTPYSICNNTSTSQFGVFNLNNKTAEILGNLDPAVHTVSFHLSPNDAINNSNPILNPSYFTNTIPNSQDLYVRVINTSTNDISYTSFTLVINTAYAGTGGSITTCETNLISINLFSLITGELPGGAWTRITGTGGAFDAIAGTYTPSVGATSSTFNYTITASANCFDSSVATINIVPQPNAGIDGSLTICDTSTTTIDLFSLVTGEQQGGTWVRTAGVGGIFNAITGTFTPTVGTTTSLFTYTMFGIAPCINDSSDVIVTVNSCTPPPVCGGVFTDSGGISANYSNNSNETTTICPSNPGDSVTITFTTFNTEASYDVMYVYDGSVDNPSMLIPSTNPVGFIPGSLAGGYWGNTIPGPFTSSTQDGCLTFKFMSDTNNVLEGWVANVTCGPILCEAPTAVTVTAINNTSATLNWTNLSGATLWEVLILPEGSPEPTPNSSGVVTQLTSYTITDLLPDQCYTAYIRSLCSSSSEWSNPVSFCIYNCENNGQCAESLVLIAFLDSNNNGIRDTGEIDFNYGNFVYQVNDSGTNLYGSTNQAYYYIFDSNPTNSYDISFVVNAGVSPYYTSSILHNNITLPTGSGANTLYFPIVNTQPYADAAVYLSPNGQPRPGFIYYNLIAYQNYGIQTIANGTLVYTKASNVSIQSISQTGINTTVNGFTYDFTNLAPNETRYIVVGLLVPSIPTVNLGDLITNTATIQISNDVNVSNNSSSLSQIVVGSYDPNDKCESHGGKIVPSTFTSNDYLYYTIQFENTGTANADFVRVEDFLNNQLDENTFEMLTASHTVNTKREGTHLTWHFYNINLPPTSSNPIESHGYIYFKIKPKTGYAVGDIIPNTASIYFDFNPAIITNTFNTEFVQSLGNATFTTNTISLFPNPTNNAITIANNSSAEKITKVAIYDVSGKLIYTLKNDSMTTISIDVSHFSKGIYLIDLLSENNSKVTKKLIIQ